MHVHHGHGHGIRADASLDGEGNVAFQQRHIGGSAAHIEGHHGHAVAQIAHVTRPRQASRRAREQQSHGVIAGVGQIHGAAGGLHHFNRGGRHPLGQPRQIALYQRPQGCIEPSGDAALVFFVFGQYTRRQTNEEMLPQPLADGAFKTIVQKGKQ